MEVAADPGMPTYSGGLGVLAGDTLRSCADLKIPIVGVSLLYRRGYFEQHLDDWGNQHEQPVKWDPSRLARLLPTTVRVSIEGRPVVVQAWQYDITGLTGYAVPLLLLDTNAEENAAGDRELTSDLYGGDERYRLAQEIILGIGGVRMLRALGYTQVERFHMNEGHAALLAIELLGERKQTEPAAWDFDGVKRDCIFTTHTPVPAGHDQFSYELVKQMLGDTAPLDVLQMLGGRDQLNMTLLALNMSTYVNGVAKRHGEVSQDMFPGYAIDSITNGIHSATWTSLSFQQLYDRHIPGWRADPFALRYAISVPAQDIWAAHVQAKARLLGEVRKRTSLPFRDDALTIGFARRATQYKRAELVFSEPSQLLDMVRTVGPIQFIFAGKAHPKDEPGKEIIRRIIHIAGQLKPEIPIAYLENYDLVLAKLLTSGVDLWLNTPLRPQEASGTSGMKAAHNGVPSLSVLDGWWVEGCIEGVTGWAIGRGSSDAASQEGRGAQDARELYDKLRGVIAPLFYQDRARWSEIMRSTIAFNASFFNTHRMVQQYTANAYV
jgi:starch phosphorylase